MRKLIVSALAGMALLSGCREGEMAPVEFTQTTPIMVPVAPPTK